jgi:imidazolonepropionase-like amidohydrolase
MKDTVGRVSGRRAFDQFYSRLDVAGCEFRMLARARPQSDVYIVVRGKRIALGRASGAGRTTVIDLSNLTVLPGLCDCHAHVL